MKIIKGLLLLAVAAALPLLFTFCTRTNLTAAVQTNRLPVIEPDYTDLVIPSNIAPLNFSVKENGKRFIARFYGKSDQAFEISTTAGNIIIPMKKWKMLLEKNRGSEYYCDIFILDDSGTWKQFATIKNRIAKENIDGYLTYRLINPAFKYWNKMGIYQRDLSTFDEKPVMINRLTEGNCMNCHNFCWNDPSYMVFHMRAGKGSGTYLCVDGDWRKVSLKTDFNRGGAYPSWHPNKNLIAFSVNNLNMFYHAIGESRDVLDLESNIVVYDIAKNMITASPHIADEQRMETFPAWSADGRHLYFSAAEPLESYIDPKSNDLAYDQIRYDLMRVEYDAESGSWGELETVVSAEKTGKSAIIARPSPDNKYVMYCVVDYGSFSIYHKKSDLYMYDLFTRESFCLPINSEETDSFHSWSSNSRWFVFTSKRGDGFLSRPYFSYIDNQGKIGKPFVLPQKDPHFYKTFVLNYNVPEISKGKIKVNPRRLKQLAYDNDKIIQATLDPHVKGKKKSGSEQESMYKAKPKR